MGGSSRHATAPEPKGLLFVFEGPDGVGKTSIVAEVAKILVETSARRVVQLGFPGHAPGTLGHHVYQLHHEAARFGIQRIAPASLQLLHVAAHLDAIDSVIRPHVNSGAVVLLDRFWWSTWVYGVTSGADRTSLRAMIELERMHWGNVTPAALFLLRRDSTLRPEEDRNAFALRLAEYDTLALTEGMTTRVVAVHNDGAISEAVEQVLREIDAVIDVRLP